MPQEANSEDRFVGSLSDSMLLEGLRDGDERAFETLFSRYYRQVYGIAYRLVGGHEEAEDLAQEAFIKLHSQALGNGAALNVGGWLFRVVTNLGYNAIRSRSRRDRLQRRSAESVQTDVLVRSAELDPAEVAARREDRILVRQALSLLSQRQQTCLVLRSQGLSYAEMAPAMGVAPGSVGTILARAESDLKRGYLALLEQGGPKE